MTLRTPNKPGLREKRYEDGFRIMQGEREFVSYQDNACVRVWYSDAPWKYDMHVHSAVEIVLTLEGSVEYVVNDVAYTVEKDEILIIPAEIPHMLSMRDGSQRLLYLFEQNVMAGLPDLKTVQGLFDKVYYLNDGSETHQAVREALLQIADLSREQDIAWNALSYSALIRIYALICQQYLAGTVQRKKDDGWAVDREVISSAMQYINQHFKEELSLDDVADFAGFSRYYFSRSFKKHTGYFFKDYLCQKRLQEATELLIRTELPMSEVAVRSGFGSVATFNRVFREKTGCTPTKYRMIYGGL